MTACNSGKFSNILNAFSSTQCQKCKAGYYCDSAVTDSTNMLTNECAAGYYCPPSSTSATPANTQCDAGTFCEAASTIELDCPKNYFCENSVDQKGLTTTVNSTHECQAGCYCEGAAATSCPSSCPTGSFCETGTSPVFCPAGTYSTSTGLSNSSSCTNCDAGYICRTSGQSTSLVDSQKCPDSYFCPTQTATLNDSNLCDAGYNCSNGATNAQNSACNNGFFQAAQGQFTCDQCQAGYYCPENSGLGNSDMTDVNKGSKSSNQASVETPCPAGTYNLLDNSVDCQPCPPGKFCDTTGIFDVSTQNCTEGYYCQDGSSSSTPSVNSNDPSINDPFYWGNGPCPKGHYCEDGTVTPTPCPIQTYNPNRYGRDSNACIPCSAGSICELTGQSSEGNGCLPGFDCTSGSQVPCEAGFYCPGGNQAPIACGAGTYNDKTQSTDLTACLPCPAGFYCNASNMTAGLECTVGNYCPEGSITETACPSDSIVACNEPGLQCPYFCPDGLYSSDGLNCISCPSGKICRSDDITVDCSNFNPTLVAVVNCPAGRYCDATDLSAQIVGNPCPAGKYVANQGSNDVTQCVNCDAGYYCDQAASTTSTENVCMDGYICNSGSTFGQSEFCPPGSFCKNGFKNPCPVGTWNPDFNQVACLNCPSGFFCNTQEITEITLSLACSPGNYCLEGTTTEDACPPGTIRRTTGAGAVDECYPCPAGFYCESGSSTPTGICDEGFYCPSGSQSATERTCEIGNYCTCEDANGRIGCSRPIPCQQGYACPSGGMKKSDMLAQTCDPGFYCVLGSSSTSPPADSGNYGPCPAGFYCPGGLPTLVPCPIGTFSSATGQTSDGTCVDCTEGSYCDSPGLTAITGTCEDGYYCPPASSNSKFQLCPAGFKCLNGLTVDCDAGTYQPNSGKNTECLTCEPGYICEITPNTPTLLPSDLCPAGYYCPGDDPNNIQRNCLPGTYNDQTGQVSSEACKACPAGVACTTEALTAIPTNSNCESGFYCLGGSTTNYPQDASFDPLAAITNGPCPAGYYCEEQTSFPTPCPDGTYSTDQQLSQISGCLDCNQGFYCPERAQDTIPSLVCPVGYYCPSKSSEPTICPVGSYCVGGLPIHNTCDPGTYQPQEGQDFCLDCPPGYYCPSGTSDISTLTCPEKYYCPAQTKTAQQYSCPTGFQCPAGSPEPQSCEVGTYTQTSAQASCVTCDAGYYCPLKSDLSTTEKITCPVGSYCPASSKIPTPCPVGTYGIRTRAETETDGCSICQSGSYCDIEGLVAADLNSRLISEGYYCSQGCKNSKPGDTCNSDPDCDGGICSAGFKCAEGSGSMSDCASGRYQDKQGQTTCPDCPGGFYCRIGTNITLGSLPVECPKGYYCPNNTANYESNMCPSGTFLETTKATDESECTVCTAGSSCAGSALTGPADLGDCVEGYYCPTGQVLPAPSNYRCEVGNYCPGKSANQTECIAGFACINPGTSTPSIPCKEGFYCPAGSTQVDQVPCPAGFYCQQQSAFPLPCPVGTYSTLTERTEPSDCINCDIGFYCDEVGKNTTSGKCAPGYYCPSPGGLTTPKHTICPTGSYCLEGSSQPTNCDFGEYQPDEGQDSCLPCPAGFMCGTNTTTPVNCPQGFYCLEGTKDGEQEACPDGTFSDLTNLASSTQCQTCPIGNYCKGGTNLGVCSPGYYCEEGSNTNQQFSCTRGHYCTDGIQYPCPAGTYSTSSGAQSANDCAACPAGSYCIDASKSDCSEGFQCLGDANAPEPIDGITGKACDPGFYCPDGETSDVCDNQNWQPKPGQSNCQSCLEGYYCPDSSTTGLSNIENSFCPAGYYCKANSFVYTTNAIPKGFYSDLTHQSTENYKAQCPPGFACTTAAISNPFDVNNYCEAGYYCEEGATNKQDILCPSGYYCEEGTEAPVMCPAGSFRQLTGARSVSDCSNCLGGDYCIGGESNISGDCLATTYCPLSDTNRNTEDSGVDCTPGHCCLAGSEAPTPCDINTYVEHESLECLNGNVGQCLPCPAGFQCATTATINPTPCPAGSYCPEGEIHLCPDGTYSTQTGLSAVEECLPCDRGSYCNNGQKQGICDAGYYCSSGAASATPNPLVEANFEIQGSNGLCPVGYYCTAGTLFPEACGNNQVITVAGATSAADCEDCPDGYDCPSTVPIICPTGFYCAGGVTTACPEGTVNSRTGQILITDCTTCSAGYNCDKTGISDQGDFKCEAGYYCEAGTNGIDKLPIPCPLGTYNPTLLAGAASDCKICPAGTFCLENSVQPEPCFAYVSNSTGSLVSSYCPEQYIVDAGETQNTQICQEGFYCPEPAVEIVCPKKFYCPAGTQSPIPCPIGFYCPVTEDANGNLIVGSITPVVCDLGYRTLNPAGQTTEADTCEQCPAGTYGNDARTTCTPCKAGVICDAGAITDFPEALNTLNRTYPCPRGYYCPTGSVNPTPCDPGSYNRWTYGTSSDSCLSCPIDYYNDKKASISCDYCGDDASTSAIGGTTCVCNIIGAIFQPSDNTCVCQPGYQQNGNTCELIVYTRCFDNQYRTQKGECFTQAQFENYCETEYCETGAYRGVEPSTGICLCETVDLETICDVQCRENQKATLTLECPGLLAQSQNQSPFLQLTDGAGTTLSTYSIFDLTTITNSLSTFTDSCTAQQSATDTGSSITFDATSFGTSQPVFIMDANTQSFAGVYQPDPTILQEFFDLVSTNTTLRRKKRAITNGFRTNAEATSVNNPVICVQLNTLFMMSLQENTYPNYDPDNLFNDNDNFDYGAFKALAQQNSGVFVYLFEASGAYAFKLDSTDNSVTSDKYFYVRVMDQSSICPEEGPFLPPTERSFTTTGLSVRSNILQEPDWPVIIFVLVGSIIIVLGSTIFLLIVKNYAWKEPNIPTEPDYRKRALAYDFRKYASKNASINYQKVIHPLGVFNNRREHQKLLAGHTTTVNTEATSAKNIRHDDFWDTHQQKEVEAMQSKSVYQIMENQAEKINLKLSKRNEDHNKVYQTLEENTMDLKDQLAEKIDAENDHVVLDEVTIQKIKQDKQNSEKLVFQRREMANTALEFYKNLIEKRTGELNFVKNQYSHQQMIVYEMMENIKDYLSKDPSLFKKKDIKDWKVSRIDRISSRIDLYLENFNALMSKLKPNFDKDILFLDTSIQKSSKIVNLVSSRHSVRIFGCDKSKNVNKNLETRNLRFNENILDTNSKLTTKLLSAKFVSDQEIIGNGAVITSVFTNLLAPVEYGAISKSGEDGNLNVILGLDRNNRPIFSENLEVENFPNMLIDLSITQNISNLQKKILRRIIGWPKKGLKKA